MTRKEAMAWVACAILLCWLLMVRGCIGEGSPTKSQQRAFTVAKTDTLTAVRYDTVVRYRTRTRLVRVAARIDTLTLAGIDTVIASPPFIASLDTIANGDTIGIRFHYPEQAFDLAINPGPDSIATKVITVTLRDEVFQEPSFAEKIGYGAIGFLVGSGVGVGVGIYIAR